MTSQTHSDHLLATPTNTDTSFSSVSLETPNINLNLNEVNDGDFNIESLQDEQKEIDKTLNFLLNFNANKRKPGRPPKNANESINNSSVIPESVDSNLRSISNINELHGGVLLDYLKKVNTFNKKLLTGFEKLSSNYKALTETQIASKNNEINNIQENTETKIEGNADSKRNIDDIECKLDELEQASNSNIVLCTGPAVINLIKDKEKSLYSSIETEIKKLVPDINTHNIESITKFGKNLKSVKVVLSSPNLRRKIISEARQRKQDNIYYSEFLTNYRSKIFYEARQLKRTHSEKISAVYVRNGLVCYKLTGNDRYMHLKTLNQIEAFKKHLAE